MNRLLSFIVFFSMLAPSVNVHAQDPNFSQFFSSPLTISPAFAGNGESNWRAMANLRNQWVGLGSPFRTMSFSADGKLVQGEYNSNSYVGIGGMLLVDDAMDGIYKSTYFSANASYHVNFDADDVHGLALGLGAIYNKTNIDFSKLSFGQQISTSGFNRALPTGEVALSNIPGYTSVTAGAMYTYTTENTVFDFGIAGYRFLKSKRSVMNDPTQYDEPRYNAHFDFGTSLSDRTNLSFNALYLSQAKATSLTVGGAFGFSHGQEDYSLRVLNLGVYYRMGDAIIPYVGYVYNDVQLGLSYDVTVSKIMTSSTAPKTFELSLIYRHSKTFSNKIPCPGR